MFVASAVCLAGCVSRVCWTPDVVSVTVRMARRSSPPPVCLSIRPPPNTQRGAGESQDAAGGCARVWEAAEGGAVYLECTLNRIHFYSFHHISVINKSQQVCLPLPDAPTPAWWKIKPTGPTTTVPPPSPGWFYWVWCPTWLLLLQVRDQSCQSKIHYTVCDSASVFVWQPHF